MLRRLSTCRALQAAATQRTVLPALSAAARSVVLQTPTPYAPTRTFASQSQQSPAAAREPPALFGTGGKYAQALFNAAKKRGGDTLNRVLSDIQKFQKAYTSNLQLAQLLDNPVLSAEKKKEVVKKVAPQLKLSDLTQEFISVLASKGHLNLLKDIATDYERLVAFERNEARATVTSAEPLSDDQKKRITDALKKRIGSNQQLHVSEKVDPKILGGLVVTVDDKAVDLSTATQIRKIDSALRRQ